MAEELSKENFSQKNSLKRINVLAVTGFLLGLLSFVLEFSIKQCGDETGHIIGMGAVFTGVVGLIWIVVKKQRGGWFAILGIMIGLLTNAIVTMC